MMTRKTDQDGLMIRYLLGLATEDEQTSLEEQFFADDELYAQLEAIEDELRYEYAQGGLSSKERAAFAARFLKTPEDLKKVELAKAVLDTAFAAQKSGAPARVESKSWFAVFAGMLTPQRLSYASGGLALVVLSVGSWFAIQTIQLRNEVGALQAERKQLAAESEKKIASAQAAQDQLRQELERARSEKASPGFLSFALLPGLTRDAEGPKRLVVPAGSANVVFQLASKAQGAVASFRAELENLDGETLWSQNAATASVTIPARLLTPGDYLIALKAIRANGVQEDAGEFHFTVVKR